MNHQDTPHGILLPIKSVSEIVARSRASIYRTSNAGHFPHRKSKAARAAGAAH